MIPVISNYFPKEADQGLAHTLRLLGSGFQADSKVFLNNIETPHSLVSGEEINVSIPDTQPFGEYLVRVENPDEDNVDRLEISGEIKWRLLANKAAIRDPDFPEENQEARNQPFPPSLRGRRDEQRVIAGQNFDGTLPDEDQGEFGDLTGPSSGGFWTYTEKVILTQFEFRANLPEGGVGRTAGSALYLRQRDGVEVKLINLSNTPDPSKGTTDHVFFSDLKVEIEVGEAIILKTFGATREMKAAVKTRIDRPYIR